MVSQGITAGAVVDLSWSSKHGVTLDGSVSLAVVIPIDKWLGPIHLLYLEIEITFGDPSELSLAVAFAVEIGPITVTLDGIGLRLIGAVAADGDGQLGPFDLELAFKPPTGFGIVIDFADIVTGGGFLDFDPDHGEYSGVVDGPDPRRARADGRRHADGPAAGPGRRLVALHQHHRPLPDADPARLTGSRSTPSVPSSASIDGWTSTPSAPASPTGRSTRSCSRTIRWPTHR